MVGGEGHDRLGLDAVDDRRWRLDLTRGTLTSDRGPRLDFTGTEAYRLGSNAAGRRIDVRGTRQADDLTITGNAMGELRLGGGTDTVQVYDRPRRGALVDGGRGRDTLLAQVGDGMPSTLVDLASGRYGKQSRPGARIRGVEDVTALARRKLVIRGDGGDNVLRWRSCADQGEVRGGPGDDVIGLTERVRDLPASDLCEDGRVRLRALGGAGDDRLSGSPYADLLAGDRGFDRAVGGGGRDRCPGVERRRSCEG